MPFTPDEIANMQRNGVLPTAEQERRARVIDEAFDLGERLQELTVFIDVSDRFLTLPPAEKARLFAQKLYMTAYHEILKQRIGAEG